MKQRSLVYRIIAIFLLFCLLPMILIINLFIQSISQLSVQDAQELYASEFKQIIYHTESYMDDIESSILRYITNKSFINYLNTSRKYTTLYESVEAYYDFLYPLLSADFFSSGSRRQLKIYYYNEQLLQGYGVFIRVDKKVEQLEEYKRAIQQPLPSIVWYYEPYSQQLHASQAISSTTNTACYGVFNVSESNKALNDMYNIISTDLAYLFLADETGRIVASNQTGVSSSLLAPSLLKAAEENKGEAIWEWQGEISFPDLVTPTPEPQSYGSTVTPAPLTTPAPLPAGRYTVMSYALPDMPVDWHILMCIPSIHLYSHNMHLTASSIYVSIALGLVSAMIIISFLSRQLRRMRPLLQAMRAPASQLTLVDIRPHAPQDEIEEIIRTYNRQIRRIDQLINENYRTRMAHREAEINALQSQINPHFIHNLLEQLRMRLMLSGDDGASRMVLLLSRLLRHSTNWKHVFITLQEEITFLGYYLELQKMRYNGRISYSFDVPETLMGSFLPRFTLQPLVENSFKHGFASMSDTGSIWLQIRQERKDMLIVISDDSSVHTAEAARRITDLLSQEEAVSEDGIGVFNIHSRLRIHFSAPYGIQQVRPYDLEKETGWQIELRLPILKESPLAEDAWKEI